MNKRLSPFEQWVLSELNAKGEQSGRELKAAWGKIRWLGYWAFRSRMGKLEDRGLIKIRTVNTHGIPETRFSLETYEGLEG